MLRRKHSLIWALGLAGVSGCLQDHGLDQGPASDDESSIAPSSTASGEDDGGGLETTGVAPTDTTDADSTAGTADDGTETADTTGTPPPSSLPPLEHAYPESDAALRNPHKGWLPYIFDPLNPTSFDDSPLASEIYTNYVTWNDFEPFEDEYRWDVLEALVEVAASRGKKLRIAINSVDPTSLDRQQVPTWYIVQAANESPPAGHWIDQWYGNAISINPYNGGTSQTTGGYFIYEPDYASALYVASYFDFLAELSNRIYATGPYAGLEPLDGSIASLEISNYGYWGEWHSEFPWTSSAVKQEVLEGFADWVFALYPETAVPTHPGLSTEMSALFRDGTSGAYDTGVAHAVSGGADMVRKCVGICGHGFLSDVEHDLIKSWQPLRSFRGEWGSWSGGIEAFYASPDSDVVVNDLSGAIDEALELQVSMLGWYVGSSLEQLRPGTSETHAEYFQKRAGYRFWLSKATFSEGADPGAALPLTLEWYQRATGKLYRAYDLRFQLRHVGDGSVVILGTAPFDAHNWPLGPGGPYVSTERLSLPVDLAPGEYALELAAVDENGDQALNLANASIKSETDAEFDYGDYVLGYIQVGA
ncbi:MAG: DUF4832 domain-containing protein [Myxococcota bacterium]